MLIAVDWGTTRLRAHLVAADGTVTARHEADDGLMAIVDGAFEAALGRAVEPLGAPSGTPVLMSGMVGSRQGWREAPYLDPPASAAALAGSALPIETSLPRSVAGSVAIVPGVAMGRSGGPADVMRGEETEVLGAMEALGRQAGTFVLPGTHSKWVEVEDGAIVAFRTFMTGDVFQALSRHTILSKTLDGAKGSAAGFHKGLQMAAALERPGDLLARLFSMRAEGLFDRLTPDDAVGALSGLLIGAEVSAALAASADQGGGAGGAGQKEVILVGAAALTDLYAKACEASGGAVLRAPTDCAARGLALIFAARSRP